MSYVPFTDELIKRFWAKVDKKSEDECWRWTGNITRDGYGQICQHFSGSSYSKNRKRKMWGAHRFSFILANGYAPHFCCHTCDNKWCVNPKHLWNGDVSKVVNEHPEWRWTDAQFDFCDKWKRACYKKRSAYITLPTGPKFHEDGSVTIGTRTLFGFDDHAPQKTFPNWRKVTTGMMLEFYDEAVASGPKTAQKVDAEDIPTPSAGGEA